MLMLFSLMVLAACRDDTSAKEDANEDDVKVEAEKENQSPQQGGRVTGAMYSAPSGMFNPLFYEDIYDDTILAFTHEALFTQNENLEYEALLAMDNWELNDDHTELTIHLEEDVTWHDGEAFTADDVVFTYQVVADPDYMKAGGIRSNYVTPLLGYGEYTEGETDEFEGVVAEDDHTVIFKFSEPTVTPEYIASLRIIPKHIFKEIPVIDMPKESLEIETVVGTGPFQLADIVEREQYVLEKNKDYWQGEPYLDEITWKMIEQPNVIHVLKDEEIDFIENPSGLPKEKHQQVSKLDNIKMIEQADFNYQLLGFKHNHRPTEDVEKGTINPDNWEPNEKLPKEVRQAIGFAINRAELIGENHDEGLLHGKGQLINAPIAPQSWAYNDKITDDYPYDPKKAAEILDEAGYELGEDGFRTDPDGDEWTLNMDYPAGNKLREQAAPLIKEFLEDVGIKINLREPKEMSTYVAELADDDTDWDLYLIGWNLDLKDPDPLGLWGIDNMYNFSRWNNPKSDELLYNALEDSEALDQEKRTDIYADWQELFSEDLPGLILFTENSLWTYNKRLHGVEPLPHTLYHGSHLWWVDDN